MEISVFEVTGKLMQHVVAGDKQKMVGLSTSGLSSGVYIITVKTANAVYRQKLIRQ